MANMISDLAKTKFVSHEKQQTRTHILKSRKWWGRVEEESEKGEDEKR